MSNNIPLMSCKLEHLPNELLLEVFNYMSLNTVIRAFYNLNNRFNCIVFSSNIYLHILYPDDVHESKINQQILFDLTGNQKYISRLRLNDKEKVSNDKFIKFSHIRSLILDVPTPKLIHMISPKIFSRLEYLRIGYTSATNELNKLHQNIFSNAFPLLKKCSLNNINYNELWTGSPSIHSLGLWSDNPYTVVERVLFSAMDLVSFHLFLNWPSTCLMLDDQIVSQHSNLKYLKLHLYGFWTLEKLDSLLAYIPTVKNLSLYSSYFDSYMIDFEWNFKELAYMFLCRLPNLSYFDCEFIIESQKLIDLEEIYSLHSCFNRIKYEIYSENELFTRIFTN